MVFWEPIHPPGLYRIFRRQSEFPRLVNTLEKVPSPSFSVRVFVFAYPSGSHSKSFISNTCHR